MKILEINILFFLSPSLQGGQTLLQGGEYMIQAVNAVAQYTAILAESFNEKMANLNDNVKR